MEAQGPHGEEEVWQDTHGDGWDLAVQGWVKVWARAELW